MGGKWLSGVSEFWRRMGVWRRPEPPVYRRPSAPERKRVGFWDLAKYAATGVSVAFLVLVFVSVFLRSAVSIEPVSVPDALKDRGWSSELATLRLREQLQSLGASSSSGIMNRTQRDSLSNALMMGAPPLDFGPDLEVQPLGGSISLANISAFIREFLGMDRVRIVSAIACAESDCQNGVVSIRVATSKNGHLGPMEQFAVGSAAPGAPQPATDAFTRAALKILRDVSPKQALRLAFERRDYSTAESIIRSNLDFDEGESKAEVIRALAQVRLGQENYKAALDLYHAAALFETNRYDSELALGHAYALAGVGPKALADAPQNALKHFEIAEKLKPGSPYIVLGRTLAYSLLGNAAEASKSAKLLLRSAPDDASIAALAGMALDDAGECEAAVGAYSQGARLGSPIAQSIIANSLLQGKQIQIDGQTSAWARLAAEHNYSLGLSVLAYATSQDEVPYRRRDETTEGRSLEALEMFQKAIEAGQADAYLPWALTTMELSGVQGLPVDVFDALEEGIKSKSPGAEDMWLYLYAKKRFGGPDLQRKVPPVRLVAQVRTPIFASEEFWNELQMLAYFHGWFAMKEIDADLEMLGPKFLEAGGGLDSVKEGQIGHDVALARRLLGLASQSGSPYAPLPFGYLTALGAGGSPNPVEGLAWIYIGEMRAVEAADRLSRPQPDDEDLSAKLKEMRKIFLAIGAREASIIRAKIEKLVPFEEGRKKARALADEYESAGRTTYNGCGFGGAPALAGIWGSYASAAKPGEASSKSAPAKLN